MLPRSSWIKRVGVNWLEFAGRLRTRVDEIKILIKRRRGEQLDASCFAGRDNKTACWRLLTGLLYPNETAQKCAVEILALGRVEYDDSIVHVRQGRRAERKSFLHRTVAHNANDRSV